MSVRLEQVVKQRSYWNKPAIFFAEPFHKRLETRIYSVTFVKAAGEVSIHDTGATFFFQAILILFSDAGIE